jgi:hypothetical protein
MVTGPAAAAPDPLPPDDRDWTWILERPCPDCGFDASAGPRDELGTAVRAVGSRWSAQLGQDGIRVRTRPDRWSGLEYGCHVRDVLRLADERLGLLLDEDDPVFANWDQDETAVTDRYDLQDPGTVRADLLVAAEVLATRLDDVAGDKWSRPGRRSNGSPFTVESLARYIVHDPIHHLWDVAES